MNIKEKTKVTTRLEGQSVSHAHIVIRSRDLTVDIDEPVERGGTNTGLSPTETAFAALVGCTNVIAHKTAHKLGIDIGNTKISLACDFDRRGVLLQEEIDIPFEKIVLRIETDGPATQAELDRVAAETARFCPVSKLFRQSGTVIEEHWIARS